MSLGVTFRRAARSEFIEAAARYEAQRPGLGATFITEIERCVASAAEQPLAYPVVHNDTRRVTAKRFPFSVYFRLEARRIVVLAVFHGRRSPVVWQSRGRPYGNLYIPGKAAGLCSVVPARCRLPRSLSVRSSEYHGKSTNVFSGSRTDRKLT